MDYVGTYRCVGWFLEALQFPAGPEYEHEGLGSMFHYIMNLLEHCGSTNY